LDPAHTKKLPLKSLLERDFDCAAKPTPPLSFAEEAEEPANKDFFVYGAFADLERLCNPVGGLWRRVVRMSTLRDAAILRLIPKFKAYYEALASDCARAEALQASLLGKTSAATKILKDANSLLSQAAALGGFFGAPMPALRWVECHPSASGEYTLDATKMVATTTYTGGHYSNCLANRPFAPKSGRWAWEIEGATTAGVGVNVMVGVACVGAGFTPEGVNQYQGGASCFNFSGTGGSSVVPYDANGNGNRGASAPPAGRPIALILDTESGTLTYHASVGTAALGTLRLRPGPWTPLV